MKKKSLLILCLLNGLFCFSQYEYNQLKQIAIEVANQRKDLALNAGFTAEAQTLEAEIATMQNTVFAAPIAPVNAIGFNPIPTVINNNPHIEAIYKWAEDYLTEATPSYPKSTLTAKVFTTGGYDVTRELVGIVERLIWLTLSPDSTYQYHPELFKRLLIITYATSDDYLLHGTGGNPDISPLDDWFAAPGAVYSWKIVGTSYDQYLPPFLKQRIEQASDRIGQLFYQRSVNEMGITTPYNTYCNRDISFAEILIHAGQFQNNTTWYNRGIFIVDLVLGSTVLYPDGGYAYIGNQNESANYHGGTTNSLGKIYAVTNYNQTLTGIANAKNYELLNIEEGFVNEFYTVPAWKTAWNGSDGASGNHLLYISQSPHWKTFADLRNKEFSTSSSPLDISFYNTSTTVKPLPNNFLVYDRNIQGPRYRKNNFSYAMTTRKVSLPNNMGANTLVGVMTTESGSNSRREVSDALMSVQAKVHTNAGNTTEWDTWAYLMGNTNPKTNMSKTVGAISTKCNLYRQSYGPSAQLSNWQSFQEWIALPDRIIGLVEVYPKNNTAQNAYQIDGRIKLGYGRTGNLNPKTLEIITPGYEYLYGNLKVVVHEHNFTTIDTASAGVMRDSPKLAKEIRFRYDLSNNGTTVVNYPGTTKKYFIAEIKNKNAISNVTVERYNLNNVNGLIVTLGANKYAVFRNLGTSSATVNVSAYLTSGNTNKVHYSRTDNAELPPTIFTGTNLVIPANEQRLLISSNDSNDNEQSWENFNVLLDQLPGLNIESNDATNGICSGELLHFSTITDNLGTNTSYQWTVDDMAVSGATSATFSSNTLTNGQKVNCVMTTNLSNGTNYSLKSNTIVVNVSAKPSAPIVQVQNNIIFTGNTIRLKVNTITNAKYEWYGPNHFVSEQQNPILYFSNAQHGGIYKVVAQINGCYSDTTYVNVEVRDRHIWKGYIDTVYGKDKNWDFGYPRFNKGKVEIPSTNNHPTINNTGAFTIPNLDIKENASLTVNGFLDIGESNSYIKKCELNLNNIPAQNPVGAEISGYFEVENLPQNATVSYKWYRADNPYGENALLIGTNQTYTITANDLNKYIGFQCLVSDTNGTIITAKTSPFRKPEKVAIADSQPINSTCLLGLRKLKSDYIGNAIRVRREKDNLEQDIPFGTDGYMDLEALLYFAEYGNVYVTKWYDQSGNGLDALQTNQDKQPILVTNGIVSVNNQLPAIEFIDDDVLEVPTSTLLDAPTGFALLLSGKQASDHQGTDFRTSIAYRSKTSTNGLGGASIGSYGFRNILSGIKQVLGFLLNSPNNGIVSSGGSTVNFSGQSIQLTNYCNSSGTNNNVIAVNNNQYTVSQTLTLSSTPITGPFTIGNRSQISSKVHFYINDLLLYNVPISTTQRNTIEQNLIRLN